MRLIDVDSLDDRKEHKLYCEIKEERCLRASINRR